MAREEYGQTWWGEQWLNALTKIDYANRIPRGKSYARRGMVKDIIIKDGRIQAKVQGSRPKPYKVELSMNLISKEKLRQFYNKIIEYPTIISKLHNGKIDPILLDVSKDLGIQLFPVTAKDMKMSCSCPDWAVPCKHIAAVLYKVCSDIDNDPFTLFRFRNIDLIKALDERGLTFTRSEEAQVPSFSDFYSGMDDKLDKKVNKNVETDFTLLSYKHHEVIKLLENKPPFYTQGNFRDVYSKSLSQISKLATKITFLPEELNEYVSYGDYILDYDKEVEAIWSEKKLSFKGIDLYHLYNISPATLALYHPSVNLFYSLTEMALHLISRGLIYPKIIKLAKKYGIVWQALILDADVKTMVSGLSHDYSVKDKTGKNIGLLGSLSAMITHLVNILHRTDFNGDIINEMFFGGKEYDFTGLSEKSIPNSIQNWLKLFEWDLGSLQPLFEVNEEDDDIFSIDIKIIDVKKNIPAPESFSKFIHKTKDTAKLHDIYNDLDLLSIYMSGISDFINSKGNKKIVYDSTAFVDFLFNIKPIMSLLGIQVSLPKSLKQLIKPKASGKISSSGSDISNGIIGLSSILNFDWRVSLGDQVVDVNAFNKIVTAAGKLIKYQGQYIYINENELVALQKKLMAKESLSKIEILQTALSGEYEGTPIELSEDVKTIIKELNTTKNMDVPSSVTATLRPYQVSGYSWMVKNARIGVGSIIADDMGLGKTLQVITFITYLHQNKWLEDRSALVVVPTSLLPNWENEIKKFSPELSFYSYYDNNRDLKEAKKCQVVITTYGLIRTDINKFKAHDWEVVIIDEAQNIKNPASQQTKAIKSLKANHHVAMSGTPVENRLMDYWSVMDFANSGLLMNKTSFGKVFEKPIMKERDQKVIHKFKKITEPFLMRRMKTDKSIISDLPDKVVQDRYSVLTQSQAAIYQQVVNESMALIKSENTDDSQSRFKRQGLVLQLILALKQICNHPTQFLKSGQNDIDLSGKSMMLMDTLESIIDANEKVLIFTQFKEMGDMLCEQIKTSFNIQPIWLHGGVSLNERKKMVDDFQNLANKKIMILSLKAGGTGLNLTAANHVIHYDLWWNPAVEAQATDRAFRIGQKKNVIVHRFITKNTFEEKINLLISSKKDLADMTVNTGEKWIGELNNQEMEALFSMTE
jgi:SNF2 family DNA or RNA helicase/uncharacterized Zn finger protein